MNKTTAIELILLFIAGLVPLLWLRSGYIISNGDDFPIFLNPSNFFRTGTFLWSNAFLGSATPTPAYALYQYPSTFLVYLGLSVGYVQIIFQTFLFMIGGFSMYYFSKTVYPELKFAGFAAGFFYMFNFFALDNRRNIGFIWIYAFLPLLLVLFVKIVNATYQKDYKKANRNIIYFALISVVAFSFASINPANLALMVFGLGIFVVYYFVKFRKHLRQLLISFGKIAGLTIPINLWWIFPILNYYFLSSQAFSSSISATAWSWTTERASFLNLFWLNGFWGWLSDYVPANTLGFYSNPILVILVFAPFLVAASALLFKSEKSRFNAYVMGAILVLLFFAKGLHVPLSDLWIYQHISLMSMFREPTSKFTLLMMPFLALLIGYSVGNLANVKIKKFNFQFAKVLIVSLVLVMFVAAVYPLIFVAHAPNGTYGPIETYTSALPFSSYVKIPDYWLQATNWINSQKGDGKVLITPLDDFYQMPYTWGYYGTDQLIDSLIDKPLVSTDSLNGYKINNDTAAILEELNYTMVYNKPLEFKALLDLLNVKYILQRNDINSTFPINDTLSPEEVQSMQASAGRFIMSPAAVQAFLSEQPYLSLVERFGQLNIYEYTEAKTSFYTISPSSLQQSNIAIDNHSTFEEDWNFSSGPAVQDWQATASNQTQSTGVASQDGNYLNSELSNSTGIRSPLLLAQNATYYLIRANISGENVSYVRIGIIQYDANKNILYINNASLVDGNKGILNWTMTNFSFGIFPNTKYFTINYFLYTNQTPYGTLRLGYVKATGQIHVLNIVGLDNLFNGTIQTQTSAILDVQNLNPTKIIVTVNASQPFILVTTQAFDKSWAAYADGKQVASTALYLGLQGFVIEKTGQFDITLEYEPQLWFYYAAIISISATAAICALYVYINREGIRGILRGTNMKKRR